MQENIQNKSHNFILENRRKLVLTGIKDVESFNDSEVNVFTELGELKIRGKELQIININVENGEMEVKGLVESFMYGNNTERVPNNFITRLFK